MSKKVLTPNNLNQAKRNELINENFNELYRRNPIQLTGAITDGTPTAAEITAIVGMTPAVAGAGYFASILDSAGTGLIYHVESDGTSWQYKALAKAV